MTQSIDHVALLPVYLAAGTAVLTLLADLALARRRVTLLVTATGAAAVVVAAWAVGAGPVRETFCLGQGACSYVAEPISAALAALFGLLTLGVLGLSTRAARLLPAGEYGFLLAASMTGGVALAYSRDLITLLVALETLTLPLYALVGLRRRSVASAQGAATLFVVSVVATAVTLLGAALLFSATGAVHLTEIASALERAGAGGGVPAELTRLARAGAVLVLAGLAFKIAAVPFHAWAPAAYDGAPLPVAAYLSTASKLGGVVAIAYVVGMALRPWLDVVGPVLAGFAVLTMTVGNLVALRQRRMVRLLAWSSVAQAGYILVPLGAFTLAAGRTDEVVALAVTATIAYAMFYVLIEFGAFGAVVVLRTSGGRDGARDDGARDDGPDGGEIDDYRGAARRAPLVGAAFTLALIGLAGLPPGLAGLFAKVAVVRAVLAGEAWWLAVVVALNVVVGLAYYLRVAAGFYAGPAPAPAGAPAPVGAGAEARAVAGAGARGAAGAGAGAGALPPGPVRGATAGVSMPAVVLAVATLLAVVVGFAPQLVLDLAGFVAN